MRRFSSCVVEILEPRELLSTVPADFTQTRLAWNLPQPTSLAVAPDGRVFFADRGGEIEVLDHGNLWRFAMLSVDSTGERGLEGMTLDPHFEQNHYVYFDYIAPEGGPHVRVARLTANGDFAAPGSFVDLFDSSRLPSAPEPIHNGGAIHFGADGRIYFSIGDMDVYSNAQNLDNEFGKILRINPDGSIPTNNPFYHQTWGTNRAIWAMGLRAAFRFNIQADSFGRMYINDVGESGWEEVDDGGAGANFGWPYTEGSFDSSRYPRYGEPIYAYPHPSSHPSWGAAITGGTFYNPAVCSFGQQYVSKYFFADYAEGFIRVLDPATHAASDFGGGFSEPVDLETGPDGSLYVLEYATPHGGLGDIVQIQHPSSASSVGSAASGQVNNAIMPATADAYVRDGVYTWSNYSRDTIDILHSSNSSGYNLDTLYKFDIGSASDTSRATLRLYGWVSAPGSDTTGVFATQSGNWNEANVTLANAPATTGPAIAIQTFNTTWAHWYEFDITNFVRQQKSEGQDVISVMLKNLTLEGPFTYIDSNRNAVNHPQLVITP